MNARIWKLAAAVCLVATACKTDSGHDPAPPTPTLTVNLSATSVVANGANQVNIVVTDAGAAAVDLSTTLGAFSNGLQTYQVPAGTGVTQATVPLITCDSRTAPGCSGLVTVTATSTTGTATKQLTFTTVAAACLPNCGADTACSGRTCTLTAGGTGTCAAGVCSSAPSCTPTPAGATTETSCSDGKDNNCDGQTDCADAACDGQQCGNSATTICRSGACTDIAAGLAIKISSDRARLPANDSTTATVTVEVLNGTTPAVGHDVTFTTSFGTLSRTSGTTDTNGNVVVTFKAATTGVAVITAASAAVPQVMASTTITVPRLGSIQVPATFVTPTVLGVASSGWNEAGQLTVQVLDDRGEAYPDGEVVHFEHAILGDSTFGDPTVPCTVPSTQCSAYDAVVFGGADKVDETGAASAPLHAGRVAGTLATRATATAGGATVTVDLPGVPVVGAKASAANFSIQCFPRNVPAFAESDCGNAWVDAPITCAVMMKDRFNNLLGTSTQVTFVSEAGGVGPPTWSPAYDPTLTGDKQGDLGTATQIFQTLGSRLPFDVAPQLGEMSVLHADDACGVRTHNPRDGLVTIIAIADGEEAFFDANGNGKYDAATDTAQGEPFIDQGEPFVDANDNGQWDPGEWFLDVNKNGQYDGPNGKWDGDPKTTKIWTQTVVLYTGSADQMVYNAGPPTTYLGTRWIEGAAWQGACVATPRPADFHAYAKVAAPPSAPSSDPYVVVASDMNVNRLAKGASYSVAVVEPGKVKANYYGLDQYADGLGMDVQYWPCEKGAPTKCASECRAAIPRLDGTPGGTGPCLMTPKISGFSCGIAAGVAIIGGDEPDGTNTIQFNADTPYDVYLDSKVQLWRESISGLNDVGPPP